MRLNAKVAFELTKENLRDYVPMDKAWELYTEVPFKQGQIFSSPLREDNNPSMSYFIADSTGEYLAKDFATGEVYDIFRFVMKLYRVNFDGCLKRIAADFGLINGNFVKKPIPNPENPKKRERREMRYVSRNLPWNKETLNYWLDYGIDQEVLEHHNVFPVQYVTVNNFSISTWDAEKDPVFRYNFGKARRFYRPYSNQYKFMGHSVMQEAEPFGNKMIITTSYKDVMCLYLYGIYATAPPSESIRFKNLNRYKGFDIYINGDNDDAGHRFMTENAEKFGLKLFRTPDGFNDLADCQLDEPETLQKSLNEMIFN